MLAVIGGTGLGERAFKQALTATPRQTSYGDVYVEQGTVHGRPVCFLPRHGRPTDGLAEIPPHRINYRAQMKALAELGVTDVLAVTAVGSVDETLEVGELVVPDNLVDYSWGRAHTYFDDRIGHVDFTRPYDDTHRQCLVRILQDLGLRHTGSGVYACTQGPRLETAAEIRRLRNDGCTIVGMTAMPEAVLARELGLRYVGLSVVVNKGAGMDDAVLDLEQIHHQVTAAMDQARQVIPAFLASYQAGN